MLNEAIELHDTLNPLIWSKQGALLPDVERKLLKIVDYFKEQCSIPIDVVDAHLVGSNASFNYNKGSDLDLHVIANFEYAGSDEDVVQIIYNNDKSNFNNNYDIKIHGIDVEVYVEDIRTSVMSNGIYSLYKRKWLKFPKKLNYKNDYDFSVLLKKWKKYSNSAINNEDSDEIRRLINHAYMIRKNSLESDGEFGKGNLLFKEIRSSGLLDDLKQALKELRSKDLSLEALNEGNITEDIEELDEASRSNLLYKSKATKDGKNRYKRRVKSKVSSKVKQFNSIDMDKFFKDDVITVDIEVKGETSEYTVKVSFGGVLENLKSSLENEDTDKDIDLRKVARALVNAFNKNKVFVHCSCPDFKYRFAYWATKDDINSGEPQNSNGQGIANPNNDKGIGCKHILLVLSNNSWLMKVASVIKNYIMYMKKRYEDQYAEIIFPAIYGKEYEDETQMNFDSGYLDSEKQTLDNANEIGRTRGQFKKKPKKVNDEDEADLEPDENQISFDDL